VIDLWRYADIEFGNMYIQTLDINVNKTVKRFRYTSDSLLGTPIKGVTLLNVRWKAYMKVQNI